MGDGMLIKKLQKYGNSYALIVDKAIMDATGITPDTELRLTPNAEGFSIRPANVGIGVERVREIMGGLRKDYARAFKRLSE